jgi:WD40 repeat protein
MQSEPSLNCDLSPTTVRSLLPSLLAQAQAQVIRPIAPSLLRSNFHGHGGPIWAVDYDKDSNQLFSGSYDQTIKVRGSSSSSCSFSSSPSSSAPPSPFSDRFGMLPPGYVEEL